MRIRTLKRIEALEKEERLLKQKELHSLGLARLYASETVLAYYLGGLVYDDEKDTCGKEEWGTTYDGEEEGYARIAYREALLHAEGPCNDFSVAVARALKCSSTREYPCWVRTRDELELLSQRFSDAYRRLFEKFGLDFDTTARDVLFEAFVMMVNQLPHHWLDSLKSDFRRRCPNLHIAAGSNLPREFDSYNFLFLFA